MGDGGSPEDGVGDRCPRDGPPAQEARSGADPSLQPGVQHTALSFGKRLEAADIVASMGRVGCAPDNAISESFVATLKAELVSRLRFPSREVAKRAIFEYLEAFYNRTRIHSSLGYRSPADFEGDRMRESTAA